MSTSSKSGPSDRYHHGDLRRALVDEALVLLAESGDGGFSLRELARRVGVTANASYRHFANKDALLQALAAEGFRRLSAAQREAGAQVEGDILPARARPTSGEPMSDDRFLDIETKLAYQEDLVASLNQIVSDQQRKLDELEAAYRKLVDRVVEQSEELAALRIEDAPPPHY